MRPHPKAKGNPYQRRLFCRRVLDHVETTSRTARILSIQPLVERTRLPHAESVIDEVPDGPEVVRRRVAHVEPENRG